MHQLHKTYTNNKGTNEHSWQSKFILVTNQTTTKNSSSITSKGELLQKLIAIRAESRFTLKNQSTGSDTPKNLYPMHCGEL